MGANMVVAVFTTFIISYWASKFIVGDNKSHVSKWEREKEREGGREGQSCNLAPSRSDPVGLLTAANTKNMYVVGNGPDRRRQTLHVVPPLPPLPSRSLVLACSSISCETILRTPAGDGRHFSD